MAERAASQKQEEFEKLDVTIKKHEDLIPAVMKTQVMVDLYWKCYAYGDELKPHIEFLDGIMLSSTRDIAPSCVENVDELIERQEKSLVQLETKRAVVKDLIEKGKIILQNPDKPRFLESHVQRIEVGWDDTKEKAQGRLTLLNQTKEAWLGYADNNEVIATEFELAEEEIKKVKKRFHLQAAFEDLAKRQEIYADTKKKIDNLFGAITYNIEVMNWTLPEDKKQLIAKENKPVAEKLVIVTSFKEKVDKVEEFCNQMKDFDTSLKTLDGWMLGATKELDDIKNSSASMSPEDRVARTMDLQEDIASKVVVIEADIAKELELLPQGDKVPQDAQDFKDELNRIKKYILDLQAKVKTECDNFSEDVKYWAEYRTGIKEFMPWLKEAEKASTDGLSKPSNLDEAAALATKVHAFKWSVQDFSKA
jgi:soluble cytochrome b562